MTASATVAIVFALTTTRVPHGWFSRTDALARFILSAPRASGTKSAYCPTSYARQEGPRTTATGREIVKAMTVGTRLISAAALRA